MVWARPRLGAKWRFVQLLHDVLKTIVMRPIGEKTRKGWASVVAYQHWLNVNCKTANIIEHDNTGPRTFESGRRSRHAGID